MNAPFGNIVYPVIKTALDLKDRLDRGESPDLDAEHRKLLEQLRGDGEARRLSDYSGDGGAFLGARYALACWVDELMILHTKSPWSERWAGSVLEFDLYGTRDRAFKVWDQLRIALRRPDAPRAAIAPGPDALETFFLCIVLGYRGRYRDDPAEVRSYVEEIRPLFGKAAPWSPPPRAGDRDECRPARRAAGAASSALGSRDGLPGAPACGPGLRDLLAGHRTRMRALMLKLLARTEEVLRSLFVLVFPMFSAGSSAVPGVSSVRRWVARLVFVSAVLFLLWRINLVDSLGLKELVPGGRVGEFWLPLFALCIYAAMWLGWWLYLVLSLGIEPLSSEFGDIDAAWEQATRALAKEEILIDETPLFLVLGWASGSDETFFRSTGLRMKVKQVPEAPDAPLHVSANRDGIWVSCPGASALGLLDPAVAGESMESTLSSLAGESPFDPHKTNALGGGGATVRIEDILQGGQLQALLDKKSRPSRASADTGVARARLRHLCRLMVRDRKGFCPVNGMLVRLPVSASDRKAEAAAIAGACRADLAVAHETFRVRCPTLFLVCDLNALPGFGELVERLPAGQVNNRRGQRFPLVPDLGPEKVAESVRESVAWIAETYFPSMVYTSFQVERPGGEEVFDVIRANSLMFRFMSAIQGREDGLAELIKQCLPSLKGEPLLFGGCYFAGTGDGDGRHAFAGGVLQRLVEDQDKVSWTADYLNEHRSYQRMADYARFILNALIALAATAVLVLILLIVFRPGEGGPALP